MSRSVPTSAADRQRMKTMLVEMTDCLSKIDDQREHMKEIAETISEEFTIPKKTANKLARTMFKHNYADLQAENEHFSFLYEACIEGKKTSEAA